MKFQQKKKNQIQNNYIFMESGINGIAEKNHSNYTLLILEKCQE